MLNGQKYFPVCEHISVKLLKGRADIMNGGIIRRIQEIRGSKVPVYFGLDTPLAQELRRMLI